MRSQLGAELGDRPSGLSAAPDPAFSRTKEQISNHQQESQGQHRHKPSGKCPNSHENVHMLSSNSISKPHFEKESNIGGGGENTSMC